MIIILGAGGHASVLVDALQCIGHKVEGILDKNQVGDVGVDSILGVPVLGGEEVLSRWERSDILLVNGIGSVRSTKSRRELFERFHGQGYKFMSVIHPSAWVSKNVIIEEGVQIMAGAVIQNSCHIGSNSIVNTGARIDHHCHIGAHVHICPGVTLSGGVEICDETHLGSGATVNQYLRIGREVLVASGAVITSPVLDGVSVAGVPAKLMRSHNQ